MILEEEIKYFASVFYIFSLCISRKKGFCIEGRVHDQIVNKFPGQWNTVELNVNRKIRKKRKNLQLCKKMYLKKYMYMKTLSPMIAE